MHTIRTQIPERNGNWKPGGIIWANGKESAERGALGTPDILGVKRGAIIWPRKLWASGQTRLEQRGGFPGGLKREPYGENNTGAPLRKKGPRKKKQGGGDPHNKGNFGGEPPRGCLFSGGNPPG